MPKIMVWPTSAASMNAPHPIDGKPKVGGSLWENDGVTARALTDGEMTTDKDKAWQPTETGAGVGAVVHEAPHKV